MSLTDKELADLRDALVKSWQDDYSAATVVAGLEAMVERIKADAVAAGRAGVLDEVEGRRDEYRAAAGSAVAPGCPAAEDRALNLMRADVLTALVADLGGEPQ